MRKSTMLLLVCYYCFHASAQNVSLQVPKHNATKFTKQFIKVFNQAPYKFKNLKGKQIAGVDAIHIGSAIYAAKTQLPECAKARLVEDSTTYMEFFYGDYQNLDDVLASHNQLLYHVYDAMQKNAFIHENKADTASNLVRETKIAYMQRNGFYHYNIAVQTIRLPKPNTFRLLLQIYHGRPVFYNRIVYEGIGNFLLVNSIVNNLPLLQKNNAPGCPVTLPAFECKGRTYIHDTISTTYTKMGLENLPNAQTEFDAVLTQLRVALGCDYVYYKMDAQAPLLQRYCFVLVNDIEKKKRKTVLLSLVEKERTNWVYGESALKEYIIELSFVY